MIQYRTPVRINTPQFLTYTFTDQNKAPINLSNYITCFMEVKQQGFVFATVAATIQSASSGIVQLSTYTFLSAGVWNVQFYCVDGGGNRLFGEPLQVLTYDNVEDLALTQLLVY